MNQYKYNLKYWTANIFDTIFDDQNCISSIIFYTNDNRAIRKKDGKMYSFRFIKLRCPAIKNSGWPFFKLANLIPVNEDREPNPWGQELVVQAYC